ncbi:hypothetical protein Glove_155g104 [Diversispora epigaea]|uniref:Uncharacterized protein n=1 Tax=Diversispora epigaea TaxID=1348612 RepID=A0A397J1R4_9GLOM|nr:hypothetical protein Glove_155g104 [Diversispora epigaea]
MKILLLHIPAFKFSMYSELPSGMFSENMFDACAIELEHLISNLSRKESIDTSIQLISNNVLYDYDRLKLSDNNFRFRSRLSYATFAYTLNID